MTIRATATGFVTSIKVDYEDGPRVRCCSSGTHPGPNHHPSDTTDRRGYDES